MPRGRSLRAPAIAIKKGNAKRRMPDMYIVRINGRIYYLGPVSDPSARARGDQLIARFLGWGRPENLTADQHAQLKAIADDRGNAPAPPAAPPAAPAAAPAPVAGIDPNQLAQALAVAQQLAAGGDPQTVQLPAAAPPQAVGHTVAQAIEIFLEWAQKHYLDRRTGKPSSSYHRYRRELGRFVATFGNLPVNNLTARHIDHHRQDMVEEARQRGKDLSVTHVNTVASIIKTACRKLNEWEVVDDAAMTKINKCRPLQIGAFGVKPAKTVEDVDPEIVKATLPYLPPVPRDMVALQLLSGVRPSELFNLRPCELSFNPDAKEWEYEPEHHKTAHHGEPRFIVFNKQASQILAPYLERKPTVYCFNPGESELRRRAELKMLREIPKDRLPPAKLRRLIIMEQTASRRVSTARQYNKDSYRKAIVRAIERANEILPAEKRIPHWHPYQLRHTVATISELALGEGPTQQALGHNNVGTSRGYMHNRRTHSRAVSRHLNKAIKLDGGAA